MDLGLLPCRLSDLSVGSLDCVEPVDATQIAKQVPVGKQMLRLYDILYRDANVFLSLTLSVFTWFDPCFISLAIA